MIDDAFGHWLAGFIDGEGCFMIAERESRYICIFEIRLRADDLEVLQTIQAVIGGRLMRDNHRRPGQNPCYALRVDSKAYCLALVDLIDRYPLRAKKARDYAVWREAVADWMRATPNGGRRPHDWSRMAALQRELVEGRRYREGAPLPRIALPQRAQLEFPRG